MVQAILDERKTATRRVIKTSHKNARGFNVVSNQGNIVGVIDYDENEMMFDNYTQPPYQPGDILYVRETWAAIIDYSDIKPIFAYKADGTNEYQTFAGKIPVTRWHPSIHMPKEAARIWLRVTGVRVERLQDITEEQAIAEGIYLIENGLDAGYYTYIYNPEMGFCWDTARNCFKGKLWNATIPKKDLPLYGWDANPWVWVIEFEQCEKPEEVEE